MQILHQNRTEYLGKSHNSAAVERDRDDEQIKPRRIDYGPCQTSQKTIDLIPLPLFLNIGKFLRRSIHLLPPPHGIFRPYCSDSILSYSCLILYPLSTSFAQHLLPWPHAASKRRPFKQPARDFPLRLICSRAAAIFRPAANQTKRKAPG